MDFKALLERSRQRLSELDTIIASPNLYDSPAQAREILREHARLKGQLQLWEELQQIERQLIDNQKLLEDPTSDPELIALAEEEIRTFEKRAAHLRRQLQAALLPPEPGEERDAIVEIRAGTGGAEAALFAADLYRMYCKYADSAGYRIEQLDHSPSDLGGFKQVVFRVSGEGVFRRLRYESGVHRVQRVPATEAQGRIHTSTATVAVLPEAEEVDVEIRPEDLRIEVCRASGPGGQGVNTTDSAVQILHIPTGKIVRCQDGRSQLQNRERALQILRSRLLEDKIREEREKYSAHRRSLIGSGGREEKIRTYNFP
ncbi:MAG: peptide chain release factor 1, partial [Chthoniobacterales bacterium]|nr:peptide chain release factor 1 [Chthoniobacterales bacterium]